MLFCKQNLGVCVREQSEECSSSRLIDVLIAGCRSSNGDGTLDLRDMPEASHPWAPWGQSPVLIWPARKTAVPHSLTVRWSHPNTCRTETGGNKECKTVREAWREATKPAAALGGQFFILTEMKLEGWVHGETESWLLYLCEVISVGSFYGDACKQTVADLIWTFYWTGVHIQLTVV